MNKLEKWHRNDVITLEMSEEAHEEAKQGGNNAIRAKKANEYIYSMVDKQTKNEASIIRAKIENILFPNGVITKDQHNDVDIVFNAWHYFYILVTNDGASKRQPGGILGNRAELKKLGIDVMRDSEAVSLVKERIENRDNLARRISKWTGESLPKWVGKD